ncbi:MAG: hypothetical protein BWY05_00427 [Euryarchaeota archaeon ADurb.Bin165]|nr:MAG: hypothetical protein BWY05_00427 [Euryarchaeota archaeon ADurb.Bin165]
MVISYFAGFRSGKVSGVFPFSSLPIRTTAPEGLEWMIIEPTLPEETPSFGITVIFLVNPFGKGVYLSSPFLVDMEKLSSYSPGFSGGVRTKGKEISSCIATLTPCGIGEKTGSTVMDDCKPWYRRPNFSTPHSQETIPLF